MPKFVLVLFILLIIALPTYAEAPLLISEVQITGGDGLTKNDYIKIFNNTNDVFNLYGYRLVKRTASSTTNTLIKSWTATTTLSAGGFYLWANSYDGFAGSLNADASSTDIISDDNGLAICQSTLCGDSLVDSVAWGNVNNGFIEQEAISPYTHNSKVKQIFKRRGNQDTNNNKNDFEVIDTNDQNLNPPAVPPPASSGGGSGYCAATAGQVVINEFVSNPGEDDNEWVEIFNNCGQGVNLDGWILEDGAGGKTALSGSLDKFFVIDSPKGQLNNAGDLIILKDASGTTIDQVLYGTWDEQAGAPAPAKGQSLARIKDGQDSDQDNDWTLTNQPTKGSPNLITQPTTQAEEPAVASQITGDVLINEILPNPIGADDQAGPNGYEFIELLNQQDKDINLKDWRLAVGEQKNYIFGEQILKAKNYLVLQRAQTGLVLNNDKDTVKLYKPDTSTAQQSVSYARAAEGLSYVYAASSKNWAWSLAKTPGSPNLIVKPNQAPKIYLEAPANVQPGQVVFFDGADSFDPEGSALTFLWEFADGFTSRTPNVEKLLTDKDSEVKLTISDGWLTTDKTIKLTGAKTKTTAVLAAAPALADKVALGAAKTEQFKLEGIVVVEPGVFGSQYFYLAPLDESGKAADTVIQVYNSKKDFPTLRQGDYVEATGELYDISTDTRLKITSAKAITILDHDYIIVEKRLAINQLKAELHNQLITVAGKITEKKSAGFFLDDGSGEIFVELKTATGLSPKHFTAGKNYQISGLLRQEKSGLKLFPRSGKDITEEAVSEAVLGEKINQPASGTQAVAIKTANQDKQQFWQYLTITAGGISLVLLVLLIKSSLVKK